MLFYITVLSLLCFVPQIGPSFCHRSHHHPSHECCWCTHWIFWNFHHLDTNKEIRSEKKENQRGREVNEWQSRKPPSIDWTHLQPFHHRYHGFWGSTALIPTFSLSLTHTHRLCCYGHHVTSSVPPQSAPRHQQHLSQHHHFPPCAATLTQTAIEFYF